ncbi:putative transcription factor [Corchorus capsularis]|uniref:Putative transcription factor n=1 Tax=Corchorus capsularis TaxID=210143 RepID=A0A1R3IYS2_COCAP|nr:putative transcription factor [Corchorus capsularis]
MKPQNLMNPTSSSSLKSRFTTRFLRALSRINARKQFTSTSSPREIFQRYRRIKVAADKSMAYSVRSKRRWSRVMLSKLRSRSSSNSFSSVRLRRVKKSSATKTGHEKEAKIKSGGDQEEADELRELVPGGEAMDLCNLLDETAHYIKCLNTQVQVMRKIVDFYSP